MINVSGLNKIAPEIFSRSCDNKKDDKPASEDVFTRSEDPADLEPFQKILAWIEEHKDHCGEMPTQDYSNKVQINPPVPGNSSTSITIIHTNDMHNHLENGEKGPGMAYMAGKIHDLKEQNPKSLTLCAGDIAYRPPFSHTSKFNPMPEIMNKIGYDALNPGNHDFEWESPKFDGPEGNPNPDRIDNLKELSESVNFPIVSSSVTRKDIEKAPDYVKPYIIREVEGKKIGITGITTTYPQSNLNPLVGDGWNFEEGSSALKKVIPEMKKAGADLIVVMSHNELYLNKDIISKTPGIDLLIGSHDHLITREPIVVADPDGRNVPMVEADAYGHYVGEIKMDVDSKTNKITNFTSNMHAIKTDNTKPDPEIEKIVKQWEEN